MALPKRRSHTPRQNYDGVVVGVPVTIPYRRYSTNAAHWWIARALAKLIEKANLTLADIDGLSISSFTLAPDTAIGLTQHVGVLRGLIQGRTRLGAWKERLLETPTRFVEAYLASQQVVR